MSFFELDIRTVLRLLLIGNLVAAAMVFSYRSPEHNSDRLRLFVLGKVFQVIGWGLLSLRGEIPLWLSAHIGNPLLFIGFSLEIAALGRLCQYRMNLERLLIFWVAAGSLAFWILGTTPSILVVISGGIVAAIYATGGFALLWAGKISHLQRLTALLFLSFCPVMLLRVYYASTEGIALLNTSGIQSLTFIAQFTLLLSGSIGFLLLLKEADDRLLRENERSERERRILQSRFIDMLTHELRAALSVVKVSGSSLGRQLGDQPPEVSKRLTNIQRAADAMSGVVERCIQLERLDQGEQPIELVECQLRDIVAGLRVLDEPSRERLRMTIPDDAMLIADGHLLGVMLDNLIDNALKYAVPGSGIQIAYATEWRDGQPVGLISVENSVAPGMAPAADKMFVRYFRGAQSHEYTGTGLGLYLVRTMARLQGGDAEYRTPAEDKVVVSICLPAAAGRASA